MRRKRKNAVLLAILCFVVLFLPYGFLIISGEWASFLISLPFIIAFCSYLDDSLGKKYFLYTFATMFLILGFTLVYVKQNRNYSAEKFKIIDKITSIYVTKKNKIYVHLGLEHYPDISFKSFDNQVINSCKAYIIDENNKNIPVIMGKTIKITITKSQLEWCRRPFVSFFKNLRFPLEIEIESFEIIH